MKKKPKLIKKELKIVQTHVWNKTQHTVTIQHFHDGVLVKTLTKEQENK